MTPKRTGLIGFDGLTGLDLTGPMEAFAAASVETREGTKKAYEVVILGLTKRPFVTEAGLRMLPHTTLEDAGHLDTLVIPGGRGLRVPRISEVLTHWLLRKASHIRRLATVCTGIYGLAPTGLLDGRRVTTHWRFAADVSRRFPRLRVDGDAIYLKDGSFYTSAGITAGIDLSLALIEEDYGPSTALAVARELVVYLRRSGGQAQYSEPLRFESRAKDQLADIAAWVATHLDHDLSVEALAKRACFSDRHFRRLFKTAFGAAPAQVIERLRLDEARRRLEGSRVPIDAVAASVGFASADVFRRAFQRRFDIQPHTYRQRFTAGARSHRVANGAGSR